MSEQNVQVVRTIYELWSRDEPARHLIDPQIEYVNPPYAVEAGTRRGRKALGMIREVYPDFRVEPERFIDAGEDVVVIAPRAGPQPAAWRPSGARATCGPCATARRSAFAGSTIRTRRSRP